MEVGPAKHWDTHVKYRQQAGKDSGLLATGVGASIFIPSRLSAAPLSLCIRLQAAPGAITLTAFQTGIALKREGTSA